MVFFIPAGGKGLICGAGSARSRRGRHALRCRCIPARGGRRPTLSSPPLSARAQAHAFLPGSCRCGFTFFATAGASFYYFSSMAFCHIGDFISFLS